MDVGIPQYPFFCSGGYGQANGNITDDGIYEREPSAYGKRCDACGCSGGSSR